MGELLLSVDLGTTSVRALLVEPTGRVVGSARRPLPVAFPGPGRVEQDPTALYEHAVAVVRQALAESRRSAEALAALGIATQRSTALAWDARTGEPLAPAIGWQDQRTAPRAAELRASGIDVSTLPSATKFEWYLENEPRVRDAAKANRLRLGTPDAWLSFRLGGAAAHVTDPGQASCTGLYELRSGSWSGDALHLFGLEPGWLPEIVATAKPVGETATAIFGRPVPLAARAGDQQAAAFAQGVHRPGRAKLTLGTSAMLDVHTGAEPRRTEAGAFALALWRLGAADSFCLEGSVITAGAVVDWLVRLGVLPDASALDRVASEVADAEGVVLVPALQGLGTPHLDDTARGLLGGLTRGTRRAHLARAAIDGMAHRCADLCDALVPGPDPLAVDGGLSRSRLLLQTLADLSGRPVRRAAQIETSALGAALLAGLGVGLLGSPGECLRGLPDPERFEPALDDATRASHRERWRRRLERSRGWALET